MEPSEHALGWNRIMDGESGPGWFPWTGHLHRRRDRTESIFQPEWSPDGTLYFISDRTEWWNLYRWRNERIEPLCPMEAEFGEPQWQFGISTYAFESDQRLICAFTQNGIYHLGVLDTNSLQFRNLDLPYSYYTDIHAKSENVWFIGASNTSPLSLMQLNLTTGQIKILRKSREVTIDPAYFSFAKPIEFLTEAGLTAHGFFYPPANPNFKAPNGELPPLLVMSHGGPTSATVAALRYGVLFWTTRGFAVLDVDYGGSSGYGRAYREERSQRSMGHRGCDRLRQRCALFGVSGPRRWRPAGNYR